MAVGATTVALIVIALRRRSAPASPPRDNPRWRARRAFLRAAVRSWRRPAVPRRLDWVVIKRRRPRLRDGYGHWWVELDGVESYGWWPVPCPLRPRAFLRGTRGGLNGLGSGVGGGTPNRDPHHGDRADYEFHPTLVARRSDWQVRRDLRAFAGGFEGGWRWTVRWPSANCRSFQLGLLAAAGLIEGEALLFTRGSGCWLLTPFRTLGCWARSVARGRLVRHQLGGPCGCAPLGVPALPPHSPSRR